MIKSIGTALLSMPIAALSAPWEFDEPITLTDESLAPHFHHLDGAGRKHMAAGESRLLLVWEDDRDGSPHVYAAVKELAARKFTDEFRLSDGLEAFEPAVVTLDGDRWVAAWEQDGEIWGSIVDVSGTTRPARLSKGPARQVTLASENGTNVYAVWGRVTDTAQSLEVALLDVGADSLDVQTPTSVTPGADTHYQGYPAATFAGDGKLLVAWEDRRAGHTRLFGAWRRDGQAFSTEMQLNEHRAASTDQDVRGGSGVMRIAVARGDDDEVQAVWLDKRNPGSGYAVWGSRSNNGGETFSANHKVQDELGDAIQQWHASVAHSPIGFVSIWDDARESWADESETADVWISWETDSGWSRDSVVPGASGSGYQGSPVLAVDRNGDIHVAWIERESLTSPSVLRYVRGTRADKD